MTGPAVQTRVIGADQVDQVLRQVEPKLQRNILRSAVRKGAAIVRQEARQRAPFQTGLLRRSIRTISRRGRPGQVVVSVGVVAPSARAKGRDWAFYADWVERGHRIVPRGSGTGERFTLRTRRRAAQLAGGGMVRPRPFLRPALEARQRDVHAAVMGEIARRLGELV